MPQIPTPKTTNLPAATPPGLAPQKSAWAGNGIAEVTVNTATSISFENSSSSYESSDQHFEEARGWAPGTIDFVRSSDQESAKNYFSQDRELFYARVFHLFVGFALTIAWDFAFRK